MWKARWWDAARDDGTEVWAQPGFAAMEPHIPSCISDIPRQVFDTGDVLTGRRVIPGEAGTSRQMARGVSSLKVELRCTDYYVLRKCESKWWCNFRFCFVWGIERFLHPSE